MTTVLQNVYDYRTTQRPGLVGMIADMSGSHVATRICETAAGIPFGVAVSQGTADKGVVIGGSAFVGISVRDITQIGHPIDPLNSGWGDVDKYPQYMNMGVMTRGHIWVMAKGIVAPGDPLYYEATGGTFGKDASGMSAQGKVTFTQQPVADNTITFDTVSGAGGDTAVTFKASGAAGAQSNIGLTLQQTLANLATVLNASADANITRMTYWAEGNELHYASEAVGAAGEAYVVTTNVTGATVTAMAGGVTSGTAVTGGYWISKATAGQLAKVSLGIQR